MTQKTKLEFEGIYGKYVITPDDEREVKKYRIALLICALSFAIGLNQWIILGPSFAWIWFISMSLSLGLALKWIHIYIELLHKSLQVLWALGSLTIAILFIVSQSQEVLSNVVSNPSLSLLFGPFFAALTGVGFKEFFCFHRPEAIGVTLLLPLSIFFHLFGILNNQIVMVMIYLSSILLLILASRKFGMDAASDIGDKSVFEYLSQQKATKTA